MTIESLNNAEFILMVAFILEQRLDDAFQCNQVEGFIIYDKNILQFMIRFILFNFFFFTCF